MSYKIKGAHNKKHTSIIFIKNEIQERNLCMDELPQAIVISFSSFYVSNTQ